MFSLIIAINNYESREFRHLRGAESDGKSFREYLISHLNVPQEQTTLLLNEKATRLAIIDAFIKLANDSRIERGDAIVIYYAGYGGEILSRQDLERTIQALVPYDYEGWKVPGIPYHTISALIDRIAATKGDNIVSHILVIFNFQSSKKNQ